jgi:hypothetical protein
MSYKQATSYSAFEQSNGTGRIKKSTLAGTLVEIKDYDPSTHSLKVVRHSDGKPILGKVSSNKKVNIPKQYEHNTSKSLKAFPSPDSPIVEVTDKEASIRGASNTGFHSSKDFGNIVKGPISFDAAMHEIRFNGLMTFNPLLVSGFPSTIATPIPTFVWSLPSGAMLGPIVKDLTLMATLTGIA